MQNAAFRIWRRLRLVELGLLLFPPLLTVVGLASLGLVQTGETGGDALRPAATLAASLLVAHIVFIWRLHRADQVLLPVVALLSGLGLVMVHRLAPTFARRQQIWLLLGLASMLVVAVVPRDLRWLRRYRYTWALLGLALVALTLALGVHPTGRGARLWLGFGVSAQPNGFGGLFFQPSELLKVLLVGFMAGYLDEKRELLAAATYRLGPLRLPPLPYLAPLVIMCGFSLFLLVWQRDLGAALLFFGIFLAMLYVASSRVSYVVMGLLLFLIGAVAIHHLFGYVRGRFDIWLNPWPGAKEESYQIVQSLLTLAAGGLFGQGLGYGYPTYIPAVHTDFVLAAIGEEIGLAGTLALMAIYALLAYRGYRLALLAGDGFEQLLATGLTTILALQALVIMAGIVRLIPLTGVTLPFVSYGGSSLVTSYLIVGLLLRISEGARG